MCGPIQARETRLWKYARRNNEKTRSGTGANLLADVDIEGVVESSKIKRFNQRRALTIAGNHPDKTATELYQLLQEPLSQISVPTGYSLEVAGEVKESRESNPAPGGVSPGKERNLIRKPLSRDCPTMPRAQRRLSGSPDIQEWFAISP